MLAHTSPERIFALFILAVALFTGVFTVRRAIGAAAGPAAAVATAAHTPAGVQQAGADSLPSGGGQRSRSVEHNGLIRVHEDPVIHLPAHRP
jgi:hypothetical protein